MAMTDKPGDKDSKVVAIDALREAMKTPAQRVKAKPKKPGQKDEGATPAVEKAPRPPRPRVPETLPEDAPVTALGTKEGLYYYIDNLDQVRKLKPTDHGRTGILDLFGGWDYLRATWPKYELDKTEWILKHDFDHAALAPAMMKSCHDKGVFDPEDKVRGCGTWMEDDGTLVMHCGQTLFTSAAVRGAAIIHDQAAGERGGLLYPRRPALPTPILDDKRALETVAEDILEKLDTWTWKRPLIDPEIFIGSMVASLLGQAAPWRPVTWVNGGKGTGKSTLARMKEWVLGHGAVIKPTNTTQAYIYQRIGDSALPVLLDEFEAKQDNKRLDDVIELMRAAASGGEVGRGGSEGTAKTYFLKSEFSAFSILRPAMSPQDISRMAFLELGKLKRDDDLPEFNFDAPQNHDMVLGAREKWTRYGRLLRGRILMQWPRYLKTFAAYHHELIRAGHDPRAATQFGVLGANFDIAKWDSFDIENATAWAKKLPAADLDEGKGYLPEPEGCLQHLLAATTPEYARGAQETVAHYLRTAQADIIGDKRSNDPSDANRILARMGIRIFRDGEVSGFEPITGAVQRRWWIAVSSTHPQLAQVFKETHWKGRSGAPGAWAQALRGLEGTGKTFQMRIDGNKGWVTPLAWDVVFPPFDEVNDAEEIAAVTPSDRQKTEKEKGKR